MDMTASKFSCTDNGKFGVPSPMGAAPVAAAAAALVVVVPAVVALRQASKLLRERLSVNGGKSRESGG